MACGWLAPVDDEGPLRARWRAASRWLERAHLVDRFEGGLDGPQNLVVLCHRCHQEMPPFADGDKALSWVRVHEPNGARLEREALAALERFLSRLQFA